MRFAQRTVLAASALLFSAAILIPGAAAQEATDSTDAKQQAKEARIAEYLRKKEMQRLEREMGRQESRALEVEQRQLAESTATGAAPETAVQGTPPPTPSAAAVPPPGALPKQLARAQQRVRATSLSKDPTVDKLLDLIDRQLASPYQLAAFGNFLAEHGMQREAVEYYRVALRLVDDDPVLWVNLGTLYRQLGEQSQAASAYSRALSIDPNYGLAHYNLGAIRDGQGKYKQAIEEYKTALTLEPTLGDPEFNPQAANNRYLSTVKMMLYSETVGSSAMPLTDIPGQKIEADTGRE
jgi:tetratricopeptide (TPR) repeat protein